MRFHIAATAVLLLAGCGDWSMSGAGNGHLRGHVTDSPDGKTYLAIVDDNNGCTIKVDGHDWDVPVGTPKEIAPGEHEIDCDRSKIGFIIPEGVVFNFDYWGP